LRDGHQLIVKRARLEQFLAQKPVAASRYSATDTPAR
jgi:hypothetical protein